MVLEDRVRHLPRTDVPVVFGRHAFSTTVAGAAPEFDRLPDFPPFPTRAAPRVRTYLTTVADLLMHCETTPPRKIATSAKLAALRRQEKNSSYFQHNVLIRRISGRNGWRKETSKGPAPIATGPPQASRNRRASGCGKLSLISVPYDRRIGLRIRARICRS